MDRDRATAAVYKLRDEALAKLKEATDLADQYGVDFYFSPAYGMGGTYQPSPANYKSWPGSPEDYEIEIDDDGNARHLYGDEYNEHEDEGFWRSSSTNC